MENFFSKIRANKMKLMSAISSQELVTELEESEGLLAEVSQTPSTSVLTEIQPTMTVLAQSQLLSHANVDVRVAVLVCICHIIRITIPNIPYDNDTMKDVFERIVECFEKIDNLKSGIYEKTVSILKSLAEHPWNVCVFMEKIMTDVINESQSDEISEKLVSLLLWNVRRERMPHLIVSFKLGETVIRNCANKLKPLLQTLVGDRAKEYSMFVVSLCQNTSHTMIQGYTDASDENESERAVSTPVKRQNLNQHKKRPPSRGCPSKYRGVRGKNGKWVAEIRNPLLDARVWLGTFSSEEEAHQAYQAASDSIKKEKAKIAKGKNKFTEGGPSTEGK